MTVEARTSWSYCLMAHSFDATLGSERKARMTSLSSGSSGNLYLSLVYTSGRTYGLL